MSEPALISLPLQRTAETPFATYKRGQAALSRRRLYPLTAFYSLYAILVLAIAFTTKHPWIAVALFSAGCATWTLVEYLFHRYVLHGRFARHCVCPPTGAASRFPAPSISSASSRSA